MDGPTVSVIIPTYNRRGLVLEAIKSVLSQSYKDFEVIVVDDGGTDDTYDYLISLGLPIKVFTKRHGGVAAARNLGIKKSVGKCLSFLDADDLWLPNFLEKTTGFLGRHLKISIVYADERISLDNRTQRKTRFQNNAPNSKFLYPFFIEDSPIQISAVLIKREVVDAVGPFNESLMIHEDMEFWNRISEVYEFGIIKETLAVYRLRSHAKFYNISGRTNKLQFVKEGKKYLKIYKERRAHRSLSSSEEQAVRLSEKMLDSIEKSL